MALRFCFVFMLKESTISLKGAGQILGREVAPGELGRSPAPGH